MTPAIAQVFRTVRHTGGLDGQRTRNRSYTPADLAGPTDIAADQRGHWEIEDRTHHVRDTTFDEDHSQIRSAAEHRRPTQPGRRRADGHARRHAHDYHRVLNLYGL